MQRESVNQKRGVSARNWIVWLAVLIAAPATLLVAWRFGNRKYYLSSLLLIVYAMLPFFVRFEHKKPQARELVTIAVMSAVAVASRAAFIMVPFFKPLTGIVMITGMALGPEAGFLTGAVSGFVSNFIFGQGPWTPWQMFAFGVAGFLAGVLAKKGWLTAEKRLPAGLFGGICVLLLIGPILDTCSLFTMSTEITAASAAGIYLAGLPVNAVHAFATFLTVFFLGKPIEEKLDRGVTILEGRGGYSGERKQVLLCAIRRRQAPQLKSIVREIDPEAFVILQEAHQVLGEGFRRNGDEM